VKTAPPISMRWGSFAAAASRVHWWAAVSIAALSSA
jgi:hypothetical protein